MHCNAIEKCLVKKGTKTAEGNGCFVMVAFDASTSRSVVPSDSNERMRK
jgi:hypothetical protein